MVPAALLGVLSSLAFVAPAASASGKTLYAAPSAKGSADCAQSADACTLPTALSHAVSGDTVDLAAGTYRATSYTSLIISASVTVEPTIANSAVLLEGNGATVLVVHSSSKVTISGITIADGTSAGSAGGIVNNGNLVVTDSTVAHNSALADGGGIWNSGTLVVHDSTFIDNNGWDGGGIANYGGLTVSDSTFSGNEAGDAGGAIFNYGNPASVVDSTFSGNTTEPGAVGGGIYNDDGSLNLTGSTVTGNSATLAGGVYNNSTLNAIADIVANSSSGGDCSGWSTSGIFHITDSGYNLNDDGTCGFTASTSLSDTAPKLNPAGPEDNGGPTQTISLEPGSPAIGHVTKAADCQPTDQRGYIETVPCDIGAFDTGAKRP
jgi:hypothetical protein